MQRERELYRYSFGDRISIQDVEETLMLALLGTESIYGAAQTRLDVLHSVDEATKQIVIDAATEPGLDLNRLFTGFLQREFGDDAFRVKRFTESRSKCREMY